MQKEIFEIANNKAKLNIPPLPSHLFGACLDFFIDLAKKELEGIVLIALEPKTLKYRIIVPTQKVTNRQVTYKSRLPKKDILTGKQITEHLMIIGDFHSHHKMLAEFSSEDDASDLTSAGEGLHYLFGNYPNIKLKCSLTKDGIRYNLQPKQVITYSSKHKPKQVKTEIKNQWQ